MKELENSNGVEFEMLKLVFFVVTYLLITDGMDVRAMSKIKDTSEGFSTFYNTLFIFSASTWVDYLSVLRLEKRKRYYDGKTAIQSSLICIIGCIFGVFAVALTMYCVCQKSNTELFPVAMTIYYCSLLYLFLKAFTISSMVIKKIK